MSEKDAAFATVKALARLGRSPRQYEEWLRQVSPGRGAAYYFHQGAQTVSDMLEKYALHLRIAKVRAFKRKMRAIRAQWRVR
jgi:hypothetical protein